jgi:hypothetical protein
MSISIFFDLGNLADLDIKKLRQIERETKGADDA